MTADHTPERLSTEERTAICICAASYVAACPGDSHSFRCSEHRAVVERILAAHLADVEARLAAVEALADEWEGPETHPVGFNMSCWEASRRLRAALHPDSSAATRSDPAR